MITTMIVPAGTVMVITTMDDNGNYTVEAVVRTLIEFSPLMVLGQYLEGHPEEQGPNRLNEPAFIHWLFAEHQGMVEEIEVCEWHVTDYYRAGYGIGELSQWWKERHRYYPMRMDG